MAKISFDIHNQQRLVLEQHEHDDNVFMYHVDANNIPIGNVKKINYGRFVMLMNLYTYVIENDIQNDFINPYGKNKE